MARQRTAPSVPPALIPALLGWFGLAAAFRLVDADEGWELMAGRRIAEGARPYFDFFTQQMPLLPRVLAGWARVGMGGWTGGRALAALIAAGCGLLVYRIAARATGSRRWALVATALCAFHALVFMWLPVVKTYGLTLLCLLAAWDTLAAGPDRRWRWLLAGVLAGMAVQTRLFAIAAAPALLLAGRGRIRAGTVLRFAAGMAAVLLPATIDWYTDPARLTYMNLGYHLARADVPLLQALGQKLRILGSLVGVGPERSTAGIQTSVLLIAAGLAARRSPDRRIPGPWWVAAVLSGVSLLPTPSFTQYFCLPVPFLILGLVELAAAPGRRIRVPVAAALAISFLIPVPLEWYRGTVSGTDLLIEEEAANWTPRAVRAAAAMVDRELLRPGEPVLAWWPGYLVGSRAAPVPGMENQFALSAALRTDESRHAAWRLLHPRAIAAMIRAGSPRLCVVGGWMVEIPAPVVRRHLARSGYRIVATVEGIELWRRGPPAGRLTH